MRSLKRGDVLMRQGDLADALYVVVTGRFAVTVEGRQPPVAELGPGQPVGEIGFLAGRPRTATVTALRDSIGSGWAATISNSFPRSALQSGARFPSHSHAVSPTRILALLASLIHVRAPLR
jgi:hypothetical protein